jgi:hypothetical protein
MDRKGYHVELLSDEPILLLICTKEYSLVDDWPKVDQQCRALMDNANEPLYLITDLTEASLSLDDLVLGTNVGARGHNIGTMDQAGEVPAFKHPNLQGLIFVTSKKLVKLALKGMDSLVFGNIQAAVFETLEEALAYTRDRIAEGS